MTTDEPVYGPSPLLAAYRTWRVWEDARQALSDRRGSGPPLGDNALKERAERVDKAINERIGP